jgi:HK97 gp10 family phage protein
MAQGFALDISGVKQIQKAIEQMDKRSVDVLSKELKASALNIQKAAKRMAPGFDGKLRQSINVDISNDLFKSVFSTVRYAPYVEFGTKRKVNIPSGWESYAAQFRGKGKGDYYDFLQAILRWVKKKKLAQITNSYTGRKSTKKSDLLYVAQFIAYRIIKNGIAPQPFFIPAYEQEKPKLIKRLKRYFK